MPRLSLRQIAFLSCVFSVGSLTVLPATAHADDYTELLDILRAKGSLTHGEYNSLLAHHLRHSRSEASSNQDGTSSPPAKRNRYRRYNPTQYDGSLEPPDVTTIAAAQAARRAASEAAADARDTRSMLRQARASYDPDSVVRVKPYVAGKGVTVQAGQIEINLSGFVNGFYTYNSPGGGKPVAGGVSTGSSGFDSSSVRNGLLPGGLILKLNTVQDGIKLGAVFGMYPGLNIFVQLTLFIILSFFSSQAVLKLLNIKISSRYNDDFPPDCIVARHPYCDDLSLVVTVDG